MKITAPDLQAALAKAAAELGCSVSELEYERDYEIIQRPKDGFLGFCKREAIIEVKSRPQPEKVPEKSPERPAKKEPRPAAQREPATPATPQPAAPREDTQSNSQPASPRPENVRPAPSREPAQPDPFFEEFDDEPQPRELRKDYQPNFQPPFRQPRRDHHQPNFHHSGRNYSGRKKYAITSEEERERILSEIRQGLEGLLELSGFGIGLVELDLLRGREVYIRLDGEDAALMIGSQAHRYKALTLILQGWIQHKYDLYVRLEIAQFLQQQSEQLELYLEGIIERVRSQGQAQTKALEPPLLNIALEKLRFALPDKYVAIKKIGEQKIIVINESLRRDEFSKNPFKRGHEF